jgi:hypothetical protein
MFNRGGDYRLLLAGLLATVANDIVVLFFI